MIILKDVKKSFKDMILFENLNLKLPPNKRILIKGINGSGKSVFLKMLVGYSHPDQGSIIIDNYVLGKDIDFIVDAGISINAPEFMKSMTGMENLLYLASINKKIGKNEIDELVKYLGMENYIHKKYKNYSLGMKQKLRIIQSLMEKPKYLILDEPFDALDKKSQKLVVNLLNEYINKNTTLIFTSHNSEYETFADIIYEIDNYRMKKIK